ncbi:hypothetical protein [Xanthomonas phage vB_XeuM-YB23]
MSYATIEASREQGAPVELYEFTQGLQRWAFASGAFEVVRDGVVYKPSSISRDRVKQSTDIFKNGIKVKFPRDDEFASQFLGFSPEEVTSLTIYRGHYGDPDQQFVIYWKGRVLSASAADSAIDLECEPVYTSIRRPGLRAKFEYGCRHVLYGRGCNVNRESYRHNGTVIGMSQGLNVVVSGVEGNYEDGWFAGGILVAPDGAARFIVSHTGGTVVLSRPLASLAGDQAVRLYPGCNHLKTTCAAKFNNLPNFGGFPWIPTRNPFDGSSIV